MPTDSADDPFHPFGDLLGLEITDAADGHSEVQLDVTDDHRNPYGVVHGAVLYAMADTGMGAALYPGLDEGEESTTVEVSIRYVRPVTGGSLTCETEVVHRGRSLAHLAAEVRTDGDPAAHATGSFYVHRPDR